MLAGKGIVLSTLKSGDSFTIAGTEVSVIHPNGDESTKSSENDRSVVIRFSFGDRSFLLTGDIERGAEQAIITSSSPLASDVIKVPHHGSRTSSTAEFVEAVKPGVAVIPVGRRSPFGHPHAEVLERWRAVGADLRTTGEKGTITISTDGSDLRNETFLP